MVSDRFAQLLSRKLSGEISPEEVQELEAFLKSDPQSQYFFEIVSDYWSLHPSAESDKIQEDVHFQQLLAIAEKEVLQHKAWELPEAPAEKPVRFFTLRKIAVAASVAALILCSFFFFRPDPSQKHNLAVNEVATKPGAKTSFLLPDGSKVWLNSESKLEYKSNFNDSIREVTLEGEAFFDVVKDKKHPFVVHTSDIDIRVLGTAFNVKSYPKETSIEATLIRGLIEITNKKNPASPKLILHPHDKLVFDKESAVSKTFNGNQENAVPLRKPFAITTVPKNIADTAFAETLWMYNKLVFDGETLRENASRLERWYNVKINFRDDKAGKTPIRYPLTNETIDEALKALQYIEPFRYKITGNEIDIWKK